MGLKSRTLSGFCFGRRSHLPGRSSILGNRCTNGLEAAHLFRDGNVHGQPLSLRPCSQAGGFRAGTSRCLLCSSLTPPLPPLLTCLRGRTPEPSGG